MRALVCLQCVLCFLQMQEPLAAQLDATLQRKKGNEPYLMRPKEPRTPINVVDLNYTMAPPKDAVDQTIARPPIADGNPYSTPVWASGNSTS
mmetsp:Transcript_117118/g.164686  ORF Transcript_117118/g.164686 Transcript_117118/m.164686 type:complete len:92 (+) Transcript_117118:81-356(+)